MEIIITHTHIVSLNAAQTLTSIEIQENSMFIVGHQSLLLQTVIDPACSYERNIFKSKVRDVFLRH